MTAPNPYALHNSILIHLNLSPEGMTFAQIYDRMKADREGQGFSLDFLRKITAIVIDLHREHLITCDDIFAEPSNGSVREREVLYKIAHLGKMHFLGLVLMSSSTQNILVVAPQGDISNEGSTTNGRTQHCDAQEVLREGLTSNRHDGNERILGCADGAGEGRILRVSGEATRNSIKIADGYPSAIVKGGGETAPALSLPPSQISEVTESVNRVMMAEANRIAVADRETCGTCGRPVTKVCPCGKQTCSAHWYDQDGNHTLSDKDGLCSECVSAVQLQTWGESRNGIEGKL